MGALEISVFQTVAAGKGTWPLRLAFSPMLHWPRKKNALTFELVRPPEHIPLRGPAPGSVLLGVCRTELSPVGGSLT
jgi:hypothetical protein